MDKKIDKIRRQVQNKRKKREWIRERDRSASYEFYPHHSDAPYHEPEFYKWKDQEKTMEQPDKRSGTWVMQSLFAAILFLLIGILFQTSHPAFEGARQFIVTSFEEEFPFAAATAWYEERFGSPLAFLPFESDLNQPVSQQPDGTAGQYAVPVSGTTVAESFSENGKGIVLETGENETIEAVKGGLVIHTGPHEEWDLAVAVQHYEGGEAWYGLMETVEVKLYDHVSAGTVLGTVDTQEGGGRFSLAIKENNQYIDPMDVIAVD
ncbi:stage IV sporulation protein FA [Alteribacillus persepolensis]|uniref:Stage IV sporulation protein FA n=1 Tax=Alteribacillus persepolensis TaxID=568899 RepID=A0A1G8GN39_9BACI|nr:peptidoglycan DD-metalloendopeptidase family protein [Alteribacillus persepolensis]SDH95878.1 stage IV sporulation protein FA [Alteribacillus persepolensis]